MALRCVLTFRSVQDDYPRSLGQEERARHLCWSCPVLQTTPSQTEFSIVHHNVTKFPSGVCRCWAPRELSRQTASWDSFAFVMVSTKSFDESCDIPNWTTSCLKAAVTTDRVTVWKRETWSMLVKGCQERQRVSTSSLHAALSRRLLQIRHTRAKIVKSRTA